MVDYKFAYLIADLAILFPIWLILYFFRKNLRKKLLLIGLLFGAVSPVSEIIYLRDYWHPETFFPMMLIYNRPAPLLEDFLFGFFIGGIASVIYEEVWGKNISQRHTRKHHWIWFAPPLFGLSLLTLFFSIKTFNFNAIYANILIFIVCALTMLYFRSDLWWDSFMSGILMSSLMVLIYLIFLLIFPEVINRWWYLQNLSGLMLFGVPMEEFLWAFGMGMMAGPLYEFMAGLKFNRNFNKH